MDYHHHARLTIYSREQFAKSVVEGRLSLREAAAERELCRRSLGRWTASGRQPWGMHVVLLTPNFKKLAELPVQVRVVTSPGPHIPPCDWEWGGNGYEAPSIKDSHDELFYMRRLDPQKYIDAQK